MRTFGRVESGYWQNRKVQSLSDAAKLLHLYLFACPHGNSIGCFVLPLPYIAADLHWPSQKVTKHLAELQVNGFIQYQEDDSRLRIVGWFDHNKPENRNVARGMVAAWEKMPDCPMKGAVADEMMAFKGDYLGEALTVSKQFGNGFGTVPKPAEPPEPEPEPLPEPIDVQEGTRATAERLVYQAIGHGCEATIINTSRIDTWLAKGFDLHLDVLPGIREALRSKRRTEPEFVPRGLDYFDRPIANQRATRLKPMPEGVAVNGARPRNDQSTDGFVQLARELAAERGFGGDS